MRLRAVLLCIFLLFGFIAPSFAESKSKTVELTLNRAISRALAFSNALEKAGYDLEEAKEGRAYVSITPYIKYTPEGESLIYMAESTHFAYEKSKKSLEALRDAVILDTCNKYYNILCKQRELKVKDLTLKKAQLDLKLAKASYSAGIISKLEVSTMQALVNSAKTEVVSINAELDNAYAEFNQMIGLSEDERPLLVEDPSFEPVKHSLDVYIQRVLNESPTLWQAEEAAEFMNSIKNINPPATVGLEKVSEEDAEKALLDAESAKDASRILVRYIYNSIKKMEKAYDSAIMMVQVKSENLKVTKARYKAGMATKADVMESELDLLMAQQKLYDLKCKHAYMLKVLEKPWAYNISLN